MGHSLVHILYTPILNLGNTGNEICKKYFYSAMVKGNMSQNVSFGKNQIKFKNFIQIKHSFNICDSEHHAL